MRTWTEVEEGAADLAAPLFAHVEGVVKALDVTGEISFDDLVALVRRRHAVIFDDGQSILVFAIESQSGGRTGVIILVAGEMQSCFMLARAAEQYAKDHGCTRLITTARCGWIRQKEVKDRWTRRAVVLVREI